MTMERRLLVFGRYLRSLGLDVHVGRMLDATEALLHVNIGGATSVPHVRALLVHRRDDLALFDHAFDAFWRHGNGSQRVAARLGAAARPLEDSRHRR